ncbi:hypothetical protein JNB63_06210 [Microbacterium trichothecenolyticum]|jgi:hypothetical protein|uniref:hypothetical protein n=1 Tax=Microbacterium trichothecenolyticum TaxID=69370 RepID=UPI001356E228|nr:hypothetical protein [Microbacterium trichothecenolyticum]MBW9119681.1 hypothetical protein [Microbacterium trichothecenolyticum]
MTDALADRCATLAQPVVDLMAAAIECQAGEADAFARVADLAAEVRRVAERGSDGIDQADYVAWSAAAPRLLAEMAEAAERRDSRAVWAAFADPQAGLHRLGTACAGQPRW